MDRLGQAQHLLLLDAEAEVPRRPGVGAVEDLPGQRAGRRHRRGVRAGDAQWVGKGLPLLLLRVGVDDHHQLSRVVGRAEQEVVDGVERLLPSLGGNRRDVAAGVVGPHRVVEHDDPAPVAARAEDALVVAHRPPLLLAAEDLAQPRWILERPRGQRGEQERRPVEARVHVERHVHAASAPHPRRARGSGAPSRCRFGARDGRPAVARRSARPCGAPPPRPRRHPRRVAACVSRRSRDGRRRPRTSRPTRPRRRRAPLRTRAPSSSPTHPARAPRRAGTASAPARRRVPAGRRDRRPTAGSVRSERGSPR